VFFVSFPESSLYQISELLHFIDFRRKFIKNVKSVLFGTLSQTLQVLYCALGLKVLNCGLG
jgi:hypothetical protein